MDKYFCEKLLYNNILWDKIRIKFVNVRSSNTKYSYGMIIVHNSA